MRSRKQEWIPDGFTLAKPADPRNGYYTVTPAGAAAVRAKQPSQRHLSENKAARRFAPAMKSGTWMPTGQPIIFDEKCELLDGQGRMRAGEIAGVPFVTYVVFDSKRAYFPWLDIVEPRSAANTLQVDFAKNANLIAAIIKSAIQIDERKLSGADNQGKALITNNEVLRYYENNKEELDAVISDAGSVSGTWRQDLAGVIAPSVLLYVVYAAKRIDADKARSFLAGVITGANLKPASPMLMLRNMHKGKVAKYITYIQLAFAIKSMNLHLLGRTMKMLKWAAGVEAFPRLVSALDEEEG
jgi:hypothetical protein